MRRWGVPAGSAFAAVSAITAAAAAMPIRCMILVSPDIRRSHRLPYSTGDASTAQSTINPVGSSAPVLRTAEEARP